VLTTYSYRQESNVTVIMLGAGGAAFLYIFFRAVEARWPENYYGLSDLTSYQLSLHLPRYLTFRFLPVVVVAFAVSVIANSLGQIGWLAALFTALFHGAATAGRASVTAARHSGIFGRRLLLAAHSGVFLAVVCAGLIGGLLGEMDALHVLLPDPEAMKSDLWTALLAGIFGAYLARVSWRSEIDPHQFVRESTRRLDPELLNRAETAAERHGTDPNLVKAILLVENMQRPSWIRAIERSAGRWLPIGTYGVMQIRSEHPVTDSESIELAVETKLAGEKVPTKEDGGLDYRALQRIIRRYNGNERFVELVESTYFVLIEGYTS